MKPLTNEMPVKVYFGERSAQMHLVKALAQYGPNVMLAYGKGSIKRNGIYDEIVSLLKAAHKNIIDFPNIPSNPTYTKVCEGIDLYRKNKIDLILAVGGGSVIDCVKVIAAGVYEEGDLWEEQIEKNHVQTKMGKYAVVLTISGAGAEMDCLGAITHEEKQEKKTFVGPYAQFVIMDPTYLMGIPLSSFMPGAFDSLTHCLETYFGQTYNVSDAMNEGLMRDIVENMRLLALGEDSLEVRSNLMWDAALVQTFLLNIGKPGDFQAHKIENTLGAYSHGTHGKQLAVILPAYYQHIWHEDVEKFARMARNVLGIRHENDTEAAKLGLETLNQLIVECKLPTSFEQLGYDLQPEVARAVADKCDISTGSVRPLTRDEIYQLLLDCR